MKLGICRCPTCDRLVEITGYDHNDPILACGHIKRQLSPKELAKIASIEAEKQIRNVMHEKKLSYEAAQDFIIQESLQIILNDTQEIGFESSGKVSSEVKARRAQRRLPIKGPRWKQPSPISKLPFMTLEDIDALLKQFD
jgi:hypothetical protein